MTVIRSINDHVRGALSMSFNIQQLKRLESIESVDFKDEVTCQEAA